MASDETVVVDPVPEPDEEGELIRSVLDADYEVVEELGRGGMAVVYHARERALDREVAIKVLPLARTFDAELVERFQREARLSASLEHPHIIPVYRVGRSGRVSYLVLKYVRGPSLSDVLRGEGRMEPAEVERMLLEVGAALDHAHGQGVAHRDVKPDNIMRDETGRYLVMDFGIATSMADTRLTQSGGSIGTPRYMSPEQAKGGAVDGKTDFYSLGVVGYHCLVGHPPFDGPDPVSILVAHVGEAVPEPTLDSEDARRVYGAIRRLLVKDPSKRAGSGADVAAALSGPVTGGHGGGVSRPAGGAPGPASAVAPDGASVAAGARAWLRSRPRGFWVGTAAAAALLAFAIGRDGAAARCRTAMPEAAESDRAVLLEPLGTVPRGADVELAYVVCGLEGDQPFTARVTIRPADAGGVVGRVGRFLGGGSDPFRASWDDEADGFATSRERTVSIGDLEPGAYRLSVDVEDSEGREAEASHDFTIVES